MVRRASLGKQPSQPRAYAIATPAILHQIRTPGLYKHKPSIFNPTNMLSRAADGFACTGETVAVLAETYTMRQPISFSRKSLAKTAA
jgi:hypothetical protein